MLQGGLVVSPRSPGVSMYTGWFERWTPCRCRGAWVLPALLLFGNRCGLLIDAMVCLGCFLWPPCAVRPMLVLVFSAFCAGTLGAGYGLSCLCHCHRFARCKGGCYLSQLEAQQWLQVGQSLSDDCAQ